jgi:hypothetical protein
MKATANLCVLQKYETKANLLCPVECGKTANYVFCGSATANLFFRQKYEKTANLCVPQKYDTTANLYVIPNRKQQQICMLHRSMTSSSNNFQIFSYQPVRVLSETSLFDPIDQCLPQRKLQPTKVTKDGNRAISETLSYPIKTPWSQCELYRPSDRRLSAKLVPTFLRMEGATWSA